MLNFNLSFSTRLKCYYWSRMFLWVGLFILGLAVIAFCGFCWGCLGFALFPQQTAFVLYIIFGCPIMLVSMLGILAILFHCCHRNSILTLKNYNAIKNITADLTKQKLQGVTGSFNKLCPLLDKVLRYYNEESQLDISCQRSLILPNPDLENAKQSEAFCL